MKQLLFWMLCIACTYPVQAQLGIRSLSSGNQQLIEDAVKEGVFIVHQTYQLCDTTKRDSQCYGWNNASNFGETYSLGVKTENGYYLDDKAIHPWAYDSKYETYRSDKQYVPRLLRSEYRPYHSLESKSWNSLSYKNRAPEDVAGGRCYFVSDPVFDNKGFPANDDDETKQGWLVWLVSADSLEKRNDVPLSLLVYRNELKFESGKSAYTIDAPSTNKRVLGGFYVVPQVTEIGHIVIYLSGFVSGNGDLWQVVRLGTHAEELPVMPSKPLREGLTPIRKR
jgi:hypothetical protein